MITIENEQPADAPAIESLLDLAFEPARHRRPSYRLREGVPKCNALCFVARDGKRLVGVVRFWPILVGGEAALLLGPIAVHPDHEGRGIGSALVRNGLEAAKGSGYRIVVAVGFLAFLGRFGFRRASPLGLRFPVKVDDTRFLVHELAPGALDGNTGDIEPVKAAASASRAAC
ncbi:MAG: GNAT family N-acetyltransferase [Alphaproteobacteria bacterium]